MMLNLGKYNFNKLMKKTCGLLQKMLTDKLEYSLLDLGMKTYRRHRNKNNRQASPDNYLEVTIIVIRTEAVHGGSTTHERLQ